VRNANESGYKNLQQVAWHQVFSFAGIEREMSLRAILENSYRFFVP
jgi:hypothetical protein